MVDDSEAAPSMKKKYYSTIRGVKSWNSFRNPGKVKVLLYELCVEAISVLYIEEKMISIDTRKPQSIRNMWMLRNDKES